MFATILLPNFYLQAIARHQPKLRAQPLAVLDATATKAAILFFFHDTQSLGWAPTWTVQQYYSFVTRFTLGFGLAFELPVVVLVLVRFGLITYEFMARTRPYAIVLIFILATIITPTPDVLTLIAMSLPMIVLYESCIWIAWFMKRRQTRVE